MRTLRLLVPCTAVLAAGTVCGGGSSSGPTGASAPVVQKAATASGDGQTGTIHTVLLQPLRVLVTLSGVPQRGDTVTWAASSAGASVSPVKSVTNVSGITTTTWTLGSSLGSQSATATLAGAIGSPLTFSATASSGPAPVIQKSPAASGDGQSGTVAAALANPLRVLVTLSGAPLAGDTVTWAAVGTGASVSPTRSVTDASGIATTSWTLGQVAGAQSATATLAGATGSPVTLLATAAAGSATQLSLASGDNQSGSPNATLANPLTVKAGDQFGNGVSGVAVTWQLTGGTGSVSPLNATSGATGLAQTILTLGGTAGPVTVTATSAGLANSPGTFHATISVAVTTAAVHVGDNFFRSGRNSTSNPAVDTIAAGGTVTWTWAGVNAHSVESTGSPSFTTSTVKTSGTYAFTFTSPGTYTYDCGVHGATMSGRVVVQ